MLTVTERATKELGEILAAHTTEPTRVLRLKRGTEGLSLGLDCEQEGDEIVKREGITILVVGSELSSALDGATIDCINTPEGSRLTISRGEESLSEESQEE